MLGRAGIIYKGDSDTYFIDSERLVDSPDVVIFTNNIRSSAEKKDAKTHR